MLDDVQMSVQVELGRAELLIDEVMSMRKGVVVPLDKLAGDPTDIVVNGRLLARGEVLVLNDKFCVRIVEIVAADS
jgi:flagellar motor switch protein FliN/FliY